MNFGFTEEQEQLRESARRFLDDRCPITETRKLMLADEAFSPELWAEITELGWFGSLLAFQSTGRAVFHCSEFSAIFSWFSSQSCFRAPGFLRTLPGGSPVFRHTEFSLKNRLERVELTQPDTSSEIKISRVPGISN